MLHTLCRWEGFCFSSLTSNSLLGSYDLFTPSVWTPFLGQGKVSIVHKCLETLKYMYHHRFYSFTSISTLSVDFFGSLRWPRPGLHWSPITRQFELCDSIRESSMSRGGGDTIMNPIQNMTPSSISIYISTATLNLLALRYYPTFFLSSLVFEWTRVPLSLRALEFYW